MPFLPLVLGSLHWGPDYMIMGWLLGLTSLVLIIASRLWLGFGKIPAVLFVYILLSAFLVSVAKFSVYAGSRIHPYVATNSLYVVMCILLFAASGSYLSENLDKLKKGIKWFTLLNASYTIFCWAINWLAVYLGHEGHGDIATALLWLGARNEVNHGLIDYSGMNGVLLALGTPFQVGWILVPTYIAIYLSKSVIPYGIAAVVMCAGWMHLKRPKDAITAVIIYLSAAYFLSGKPLLQTSMRWDAYKLFMGWWWTHANRWLGTGPSTFPNFSPGIQYVNHFQITNDGGFIWGWMHSDWLQCLFEYGIIGFVLIAAMFLDVAYRLWKKDDARVFALWLGLGASAVFDYPLRYFLTAFLMAVPILAAYTSKRETHNV